MVRGRMRHPRPVTSVGVLCFPLGTKRGQSGNGSQRLSPSTVITALRIPHRAVVWPGEGLARAWRVRQSRLGLLRPQAEPGS